MTSHEQIAWRSMARLTTVADVASAHVLAAHLDHEGIDCHIRGEALGPYPIAVGSWGETEIWVSQSDLGEATEILEEIQTEAQTTVIEPAGVGKSPDMLRSVIWWVIAAALVAWIIYLRIIRML